MKSFIKPASQFISIIAILMALVFGNASANNEVSAPVMGGYDPVSYFDSNEPLRGDGHYAVTYNGGTYLFAKKTNKQKFEANPEKYAPQFGGYCAFGVAVGKKFHSDPTIWKVVDGKLYLNLNKDIQNKWNKNINGFIAKADTNWKNIEHKNPAEL